MFQLNSKNLIDRALDITNSNHSLLFKIELLKTFIFCFSLIINSWYKTIFYLALSKMNFYNKTIFINIVTNLGLNFFRILVSSSYFFLLDSITICILFENLIRISLVICLKPMIEFAMQAKPWPLLKFSIAVLVLTDVWMEQSVSVLMFIQILFLSKSLWACLTLKLS